MLPLGGKLGDGAPVRRLLFGGLPPDALELNGLDLLKLRHGRCHLPGRGGLLLLALGEALSLGGELGDGAPARRLLFGGLPLHQGCSCRARTSRT